MIKVIVISSIDCWCGRQKGENQRRGDGPSGLVTSESIGMPLTAVRGRDRPQTRQNVSRPTFRLAVRVHRWINETAGGRRSETFHRNLHIDSETVGGRRPNAVWWPLKQHITINKFFSFASLLLLVSDSFVNYSTERQVEFHWIGRPSWHFCEIMELEVRPSVLISLNEF